MIKDILAIVDNAERAAPFVRAALAFAESRGAHLRIAALTAAPYFAEEILPLGVAYLPEDILARDDLAKVDAVSALAAGAGCPVAVLGLHDDIAWLAGDVRRSRQIADIVLIGSDEHWQTPWLRRRVVESSILSAGTPTVILPVDGRLAPVRHAVLGWKSSAEANRAVHDLVAFAEPGARIDILMVGGPEDGGAADSGGKVREHLRRHGFAAELHRLPHEGMSEAESIQGFAARSRADLLVVGGYAHSRLREIVLGGVTRSLVEEVLVATMLSH